MSESRDEGAVKMVETGGGGEKKVRRSNADNSNRWEVGVREGGEQLHQTEKQKQCR